MDAIWVRTHPYGAPYVCARSRSGLRGRRASSQHQYIGARPHPGPMVKNMIPRQRSRPRPRAYSASIWTSGRGRAPPNRGVQSRIGPERTSHLQRDLHFWTPEKNPNLKKNPGRPKLEIKKNARNFDTNLLLFDPSGVFCPRAHFCARAPQ